jgi:hypothetical protein
MLFADDSANNVAGAERVALGGHVYVDADTLAEIMRAGRIAGMERIAAVDDRRTAIERRPELSTPGARRAVRPLDDPAWPKFGRKVAFAGRDPATHGDAGLVHAVGRTRNERMPVVQIPSLGDQPIGAGDGEPAQRANRGWGQFDAIGNPPVTLPIIEAPARLGVKQLATDVSEMDLADVFILELDEAAAAAAVAQALPLAGAHLLERLDAPKWLDFMVFRRHCVGFRPLVGLARERRPLAARA